MRQILPSCIPPRQKVDPSGNHALLLGVLLCLLGMISHLPAYGQCTSGNATGATSPDFSSRNVGDPGYYNWYPGFGGTFNAVAGYTYRFSTCANDIPSNLPRPDYDTQITVVRNSTNTAVAYNDDACATPTQGNLASNLTWTATFTGPATLYIHQFNCQSDPSNSHRIYVELVSKNQNQPDYTVSNFNSSTSTVGPGGSLVMNLTIQNIGNAAGNGSGGKDRYYLSTNSTLGGGDVQLKSFDTGSLNAGANFNVNSGDLTIPPSTPLGNYYILFYIDADDVVSESNEGNNLVSYPITVANVDPDYVPVNFSLSTTNVSPGQEINTSGFVRNIGSGAAQNNSRAKVYYSNDGTLDGGDQEIGNDDVEPLAPNQQTPENEAVTIPGNAQLGTRYIFYKVDADNQINESNENNNVASVAINVTGSPDLIVDNVSVSPNNGAAGTNVSVSATVRNIGNAYAGVSQLGYYFSSDNNYDGGDTQLGTDNVSDMGAGGSSSENANFSIPSVGPGTYYILFRADNQGVISESNEGNNVNSVAFTVGSPPNANFSASSTNVCQGETVSFTDQSSGSPSSYSWSFSPSTVSYQNGTGSSSANPQVQFNAPGSYTVSLTVSNSSGSDTETRNNYITVSGSVTPTVSISANQNNVCQGELVTFTANVSGGGSSPSYQWRVNGSVEGTSPQFSSSTLSNGDQVQLSLTSSAACASPATVNSNTVVMSISGSVTPTVTISASQNNVCPGDPITFTANVSGGGASPTYQWRVNGSVVSSATSYTSSSFSSGDQVQLSITSNAPCASPASATSNTVVVQIRNCINPPVAAFSPTNSTICPGESVQFANQSTGSGNTYQWTFSGGSPSSSTSANPTVNYPNPGTYPVTLVATNAGGSSTAQGSVTVQSSCGPNWPVNPTGDNHTIIVEAGIPVMIDGAPIAPGDYLGVYFMDNGVERYAGKAVWTGQNISVTVYGDDTGTPQKDGYSPGEAFKWRLWKASTEEEVEATATYQPVNAVITHTGQFANDGISSLASLMGSAVQRQQITLQPGWNTISSYIQADNPSVSSIFAPIQGSIILVKNGTGQIYFPSSSINTIGNWQVTQGYKVKISGSVPRTLTISGSKVNPGATPINLNAGWNMIAYLRDTPQPVQTAMASLGSNLILVKNNAGEIYSPSFGINNIGNLQPGQGYQVRMANAGVLTYSQSRPASSNRMKAMHTAQQKPRHYRHAIRSGANASFFLHANSLLEVGDEIGVFSSEGELVGSAVYEGHTLAFPIWGAEQEGTVGLKAGEAFHLRIWREGRELAGAMVEYLSPAVYEDDAVIEARLADFQVPNSVLLFPNPAQGQTTLSMVLSEHTEVAIDLYTVSGQLIRRVGQLPYEAGRHEVALELSELPEGLYQVWVLFGKERRILKLSVAR